ncbi:hypothetical protein ABPG77_004632 [Micractinium sp. CCAP 211/92]
MTITAPDPRSGWQAALELLPLLGPQLEMLWLTVAPRHSLTLLCQVDVPAPPAELLQSLPRRFPRLRLLRLRTVPKLEREGSAQDAASLLDNPERLLANCLPLPALWPAALAQLPLTDLQLDVAHPLPDGLVASLPTGLTWLRLAVAAAPLAQLQGLTALSQLQGLELCDGRQAQSGALLAVPAPAAFPKLQHFEVFGRQAKLQVGHFALSSCTLTCHAMPDGSSYSELEVFGMSPQQRDASLSQLLATLLPAGAPALGALTLERTSCLSPALVRGCSQLSRLSALRLDSCGGADEWLGALASQAPGLTSLRCDACYASIVPSEVAALGSLRELIWLDNELSCLPVGPYLSGLERLQLSNNQLDELPAAALAAATACRQLGLDGNPLQASAEQLEEVLLRGMPALTHVDLYDTDVDVHDVRLLSNAARHALRRLRVKCDGGDGWAVLYGEGEEPGGGLDSSDSGSSDDGCPRYSWAGCAYAAHW